VEAVSTSSVPPISTDATRAAKPVILLVEDELLVREVTRQVLEHGGYQVLESDGPREALRLAAEHRGSIRLLLSDVIMPEMNGPDLARHIRNVQPDLTTVFMSGYAQAAMLQGTMKELHATYLQKPFTVELLLSCVSAALKGASHLT
jgi:two-component system, cell cycle sensor histidine kinase and response regulator CckA